jgi:hypothetical protein
MVDCDRLTKAAGFPLTGLSHQRCITLLTVAPMPDDRGQHTELPPAMARLYKEEAPAVGHLAGASHAEGC